MGKQNKSQSNSSKKNQKKRILRVFLGGIVVVAIVAAYMNFGDSPAYMTDQTELDQATPASTSSTLRNRMVLPATPRRPRPITRNPDQYNEPEVRKAYQSAKEAPEVVENMACYCGCFASAGHRSNLDCFTDDHGVSCAQCRTIAIESVQMSRMGTPVSQIKRIIDERYSPPVR